jgi:hypothetical protein
MKTWKAFTEKEAAWPFVKVDEALNKTAFRSAPKDEFEESPHRQFEQNPLLEVGSFLPEVKLAIDTDLLCEKTSLSLKQMQASVAVRDRSIRRFVCIRTWKCDEADGKTVPIDEEVLRHLSGRRNLEIVTTVTPVKKVGNYSPGDRIAEKVFECALPGETKGGFPIAIVDPSEPHWDESYSAETAWYISWKPAAIFSNASEAEHVLSIVYNKQCADKILHFENEGNRASGLFNIEMAVEVFHEVACVYLSPPNDSTEPPDFKKSSFYPKIVSAICKMMDVDANLSGYQELKQRYKSKVGFMSLLRSKLQGFYGLKDKINRVRAA